MKYLPIDSHLFIENRKKFAAELVPNSMAIFHANDEMPKSADMAHVFRQKFRSILPDRNRPGGNCIGHVS
jgi:hypothetical protein